MRLSDFNGYDKITVQCHDNPDADAIASAYGLYCYYQEQGKEVQMVYGGKNQIQKDNLQIMIRELEIPIVYVKEYPYCVEGLLITVDCQYGAKNVTTFQADAVASIDHHQLEIDDLENSLIRSNIGACATIVWQLLKQEQFAFDRYPHLQTALYYGLYMDTGQLTEIGNPLDKDMRDSLVYNQHTIRLLMNSNISMKELEVAGVAMLRCICNEAYRYAVVAANPCDPNVLGLISDLVLQVSGIDSCVVFNEVPGGIKFSVRSCTKTVKASDLAVFLTKDIGSGGGHLNKAGGFIGKVSYEERYPNMAEENYFTARMREYMQYYQIVDARTYKADLTKMVRYKKKPVVLGYVEAGKVVSVGDSILVRTLEGDVSIQVEEDTYIMIGIKGEVYPITRKKFTESYVPMQESYEADLEYKPTLTDEKSGRVVPLMDYAKSCRSTGTSEIYAKPLEQGVKVFTTWNSDTYMLGEVGDILAVRKDDLQDVYVIEKNIFEKIYKKCDN